MDCHAAFEVTNRYIESWILDDTIHFGRPRMKWESLGMTGYTTFAEAPERPEFLVHACIGETLEPSDSAYPQAPIDDRELSTELSDMWKHYRAHYRGEERFEPMAYYCLTVLEKSNAANMHGGGRSGAARAFNISETVLKKFGYLTSEREGRKAGKPEWTPSESEWVTAALNKILGQVRAASFRGGVPSQQLTMADLPSLRR